jgi:integrase
LYEYAREWVERYHGTGRRGFRDETRSEYRVLLNKYALRYFAKSTRLCAIGPRQVAEFVGWLVKQPNGREGNLSDKSVRNALGPLRAVLATAKREGLIRDNPAMGAALPHRPRIEEDEKLPRPFPRIEGEETMELAVALVQRDHRLMFELLAATGLRRSELVALEVRHLALDGAGPHVRVRQRARWQRGSGQVIGPLKSRHARRDLPIPLELADRLRALVADRPEDALVFVSPETGRPYDPHHLHLRVLKPACAEAGVEWAGFHTFRPVASRMFASGRNAVQVQHWLGHHSASFTLATYVHLLDGDLGGPIVPHPGRQESANKVQTCPTPSVDTRLSGGLAEVAD